MKHLKLFPFFLLFTIISYSQNPYDECSNAAPVILDQPSPLCMVGSTINTFFFDNFGATTSNIGGAQTNCSNAQFGADMWVSFTAVSSKIQLKITGELNFPNVRLFLNTSCDFLTEIDCEQVENFGEPLNKTFDVNLGQDYLLLVSGGGINDQGVFGLEFTSFNVFSNTPPNNTCANAESLDLVSIIDCPSQEVSVFNTCGDITFATASTPALNTYGCTQSVVDPSGKDVWFSFTAVSNRILLDITYAWNLAGFILFEGTDCNNIEVIDCFYEVGDYQKIITVEQGKEYFLVLQTIGSSDDGLFELSLTSYNSCFFEPEDACTSAKFISLNSFNDMECPSAENSNTIISDSFTLETPYYYENLSFGECSNLNFNNNINKQKWYRIIVPRGITEFQLSTPNIEKLGMAILANGCSNPFLLKCDSLLSTAEKADFSYSTNSNTTLYMVVWTEDENTLGNFSLDIQSSCLDCASDISFSAFPPPLNGSYNHGDQVEFCFSIFDWYGGFGGEWLHSITLDIGCGWQYDSLQTFPPESCNGNGTWEYFEEWESCINGQIFGPGFAYESISGGINCNGLPMDNNPGNNFGDGGGDCSSSPLANPFTFCWTLVVNENAPNGTDLSIGVNYWTDAESGSFGATPNCNLNQTFEINAEVGSCSDEMPIIETLFSNNCSSQCLNSISIIPNGGIDGIYTVSLLNEENEVVDQYVDVNNSELIIQNICSGDYTVKVLNTDSLCQRQVDIFFPEFHPELSISTTSLCENSPANLSADINFDEPNVTFMWSGPNGQLYSQQNISVQDSGWYYLEVNALLDCDSIFFDSVFVEQLPSSSIPSFIVDYDSVGCLNETIILEIITDPNNSIIWSTGETSTSIQPILTQDTSFSIEIFSPEGCSNIDTIYIEVEDFAEPSFSYLPFDFNQQSTAGLCPTNTWLFESQQPGFTHIYNGLASDFYFHTIPPFLEEDIIIVESISPEGCSNIEIVTLEPYYPDLFEDDTLFICPGEATISLDNSLSTDNILWNTGDTTASINIIVDQIQTYSVTIDRGCSIIDSITIVPLSDLTVNLGPDQFFCEAISSSLSANPSGGTPPFTYEWIASDGSQSDSAILAINPILGNNEYIINVVDSLGCSTADTIQMTIEPISPPTLIQTPACEGEISFIEVTPNNYTQYDWSNGDLGPIIPVSTAGLYCVTVTDINNCSTESCIDVTFEPLPDPVDIFCTATLTSIDFNWANTPNLNYQVNVLTGQIGTLNNNSFIVDGLTFGQSVTIELIITNTAGCTTTVTQSCTTQDCPNIDIQITPIPDICLSANATPITLEAVVTGSMGMGMSSWSGPGIIDATNGIFDPLSVGPGLHTVVFTYEEGGCIANAAINIQVDEPILPPIISCAATTTSIEFAWNDVPGAAAYSVNVLSGPSGIITSNSYVIEGLNPGEEVCIEVIADPATSCDPVSAQLCCTAEACPSIQIDVQDTYNICEDATPFQIPVNITGGEGNGTITWTGPCIDNNGMVDPTLCGLGVNTFFVTYTEGPCVYEEDFVVIINQKPTSDFVINPLEACINQIVNIDYSGNASANANFSWNFSGATIITGQEFGPYEVSWDTDGVKTISLVVEENGCVSEEFSQEIVVTSPIDSPEVFCASTTSAVLFQWSDIIGANDFSVNLLEGPTGDLGILGYTVTGLDPEETVTIEVIANTDNVCGNTSTILSCSTLPCPDITISLDTPYPTVCLSDEDSPTDFLLSAVIVGGNGVGDELWSGPGIIDPLAGIFDPNEAGIGIHEITYTYTEDNCSYQESLTIEVTTELMFENINLVCSDDEETYSLTLDIITPDGIIPFQSEAVDNGDPLQVSIDNAPGCGSPFFYETTRECDCLTYAGTLDLAIDNLCGLPSIELTHNGDDFLVEDDILRFILHSNNGNVLGEIFAISETPNFSLEGDLEAGVTYYVSAVAGNTSSFETLNLDDPCLSVSPPQAVVFAEAIDLAVSQDTFICSGEIYQLVATFNNADSLAWSPVIGLSCVDCPNPIAAPDVSTTYTITAYNDAGCTEQTNVTIYVDEIPNFLPNEPIAVCPGEYVDICLPDALAYEWNGPNGYFSIDQCLVWPDFDPIYGGTYTVEIQISENCTITDQLELFATPEQTINFLTPDFAACPNEVFTLSADIEGAVSYRWFPTENVEDNQSPTTNAFTTTPTAFTLQTVDQYGCEGLFVVFVTNETDCEIDGEIPLSDFTGGNNTQQLAQHKNNMATPIRVFPNPSTNIFNITSPSIIQTIEVFHINGQLVDQYQPNESNYRVDAQHWQAGTYLIRIKNQNGIHHQRVVKIQE